MRYVFTYRHRLLMSRVAAIYFFFFFFSSRRRHTRCLSDWSSDVCSSDLPHQDVPPPRDQGIIPYMHDGRLLTLEDTVEYFNLICEAGLTAQEKADIVAFLRVL